MAFVTVPTKSTGATVSSAINWNTHVAGNTNWLHQHRAVTGLVLPYAGTASPDTDAWLLCDGAAVSRTTYADLFAVIGTTFGTGDGSTTFNLPDLRGRMPLGLDNMGGTSADRATETEADSLGGTEGDEDGVAAHTHTDGGADDFLVDSPSGSSVGYAAGPNNLKATANTASTGDATGGNMPPYISLGYLIKT